jgi:hypothetical protein
MFAFILADSPRLISLKQQSAGRHAAPLGHNIRIPSPLVFALTLNAGCLEEKQQIPIS